MKINPDASLRQRSDSRVLEVSHRIHDFDDGTLIIYNTSDVLSIGKTSIIVFFFVDDFSSLSSE